MAPPPMPPPLGTSSHRLPTVPTAMHCIWPSLQRPCQSCLPLLVRLMTLRNHKGSWQNWRRGGRPAHTGSIGDNKQEGFADLQGEYRAQPSHRGAACMWSH